MLDKRATSARLTATPQSSNIPLPRTASESQQSDTPCGLTCSPEQIPPQRRPGAPPTPTPLLRLCPGLECPCPVSLPDELLIVHGCAQRSLVS